MSNITSGNADRVCMHIPHNFYLKKAEGCTNRIKPAPVVGPQSATSSTQYVLVSLPATAKRSVHEVLCAIQLIALPLTPK